MINNSPDDFQVGIESETESESKTETKSTLTTKSKAAVKVEEEADEDRDDFEGFGSITELAKNKDALVECN